MESDRGSILKKMYMKFFLVAIILLITGVSLITVRTLFTVFADPGSPDEYEFYYNFMYTFSALSGLTLELGMIFFALSTFWGAITDKTLSEVVRRGMIFTTSIAIIALAFIMIFQGLLIY